MNYPHEYLPIRQVGLRDLYKDSEPMIQNMWSEDLALLHLAGRYSDGNNIQRVFVNPSQGMDRASRANCTLTGDFDSLIGFTRDLPLKMPLSIYPVPLFSETLTRPVHVPAPLWAARQDGTLHAPHKIANLCIGKFEQRSQVRIMFPHHTNFSGTLELSQNDLQALYEDGILPAVHEVAPAYASDWPCTYAAALILARDKNNHIHKKSCDLPEASLSNFAQAVRSNLAHNPRLKEPFFMIELRGTKGAYAFDPDDPDDLEFHFNLFVERLNFSIALEDAPEEAANWYCDIGLEVSRQ
ncbi:hypothetical protein L227DRAFT_568886, partial [Lentinus tigrinus ALCF2SS1-6]